MHPAQFWRSMTDALFWREFFTLPQVPRVAVKQTLTVLCEVLTENGEIACEATLRGFVREACLLSERTQTDRLSKIPTAIAKQQMPNIYRLALGSREKVNQNVADIFSAGDRNYERFILFEHSKEELVYMPSPIANAAICERAFTFVWETIPAKNAAKIVGQTIERVLADACKVKAPTIEISRKYKGFDGKNLEMDVGIRDADKIVLIEAKSKALTARSRQSGGFSYIADYTKSYLAMIKQLMLHEKSIRSNLNPLVDATDDFATMRPLKIAVSPLSYGQLGDKVFASSIIRGLFNANLVAAPGQDPLENIKVVEAFNESLSEARSLIVDLAPKRNGFAELAPYLIDFFWVDLGQAVYVLHRANSVINAFQPLKHITFSTRDFWTEVATADRGGMTRESWSLPNS